MVRQYRHIQPKTCGNEFELEKTQTVEHTCLLRNCVTYHADYYKFLRPYYSIISHLAAVVLSKSL
jgi:hypothetical protein